MMFVNGPSPQIPINASGIGFDNRYVFSHGFGGMPLGFGQYPGLATGGSYPVADGLYFFNSPLPHTIYYAWPRSLPMGYSGGPMLFPQP
jgi:hypothetical protein